MRLAERRGIALLDALVAVVLLTLLGLGTVRALLERGHALSLALAREEEVRSAEAILSALEARPRHELERLVGRRTVNGRTVAVSLIRPDVFAIEVGTPSSDDAALWTALYRPPAGGTDARDR